MRWALGNSTLPLLAMIRVRLDSEQLGKTGSAPCVPLPVTEVITRPTCYRYIETTNPVLPHAQPGSSRGSSRRQVLYTLGSLPRMSLALPYLV